jgi:hypothetical protein
MLQVLGNFMGYSNQKTKQNNFNPFLSYIGFSEIQKNR